MSLTVVQIALGVVGLSCSAAGATEPPGKRPGELATGAGASDMRELVGRWAADRGSVRRSFPDAGSPGRFERFEAFTREWLGELEALDFESLDREGRVDWLLLCSELEHELARLAHERIRLAEIEPLVPFGPRILALEEARLLMEPLDPELAADELHALERTVQEEKEEIQQLVQAGEDRSPAEEQGSADRTADPAPEPGRFSRAIARRAAEHVDELLEELGSWHGFRAGYDPLFDWWVAQPYQALREGLEAHAKLLREELAGLEGEDDPAIVGDPIGREALLEELRSAMIPYTPEELIAIAGREFAWCEEEMLRAAREMGCGEDWKAALERVKQDHAAPGEQPALIRELALEAIEYVEANELVTVPPLARETWRMEMLSPEAQRESPFFLGGETILVSFPTDGMTHEEKLMSMRGNNRHFARATVHHELIPGHHLQGFMTERHQRHRRPFGTPFWTEGWALWWEMLLWERGFFATPEDRVGALFWRMHRCARVEFSLGFHLGQLTPEQCIDLLVERVGHERKNAEAEVRRSFEGGYGPLYQIAYLVGALQFRALYRELVDSGRMSPREFHDAVLQGGTMPVELVRARLAGIPLERDFQPSWRFYELEK